MLIVWKYLLLVSNGMSSAGTLSGVLNVSLERSPEFSTLPLSRRTSLVLKVELEAVRCPPDKISIRVYSP